MSLIFVILLNLVALGPIPVENWAGNRV